jgi:hypothetical protein
MTQTDRHRDQPSSQPSVTATRLSRNDWSRPILPAVIALVAGLTTSASAQNAPIQATPLPPLQEQSRPGNVPSPPTLPANPAQVDPKGQGLPGSAPSGQAQAPAAAPPTSVERPNIWVPAAVAKVQALDKVNAQTSDLTIKVGQSTTFGSLTITVKSCMIRPPDQPADAAAYLDVTDSHPDSPGFDGWMLQDEPSVSMMQHPIYDLRVTGCA